MKLGKALATGVAEERPPVHEEELDVPEEIREPKPTVIREPQSPAPEEAPAAR
ncbi:hypothetical protein [Streptomyces sp. NPDC001348]